MAVNYSPSENVGIHYQANEGNIVSRGGSWRHPRQMVFYRIVGATFGENAESIEVQVKRYDVGWKTIIPLIFRYLGTLPETQEGVKINLKVG